MKNLKEQLMHAVFLLSACVSILCVAMICVFLFANGIPAIGKIGVLNFLTGEKWKPGNNLFGLLPMILGSIYVTAGAVIIGVPIGILTAVFMSKFCPKRVYKIVKPAIDLLAGIPSVVYGFFGMVVIVPVVSTLFGGSGKSMLTASILLGIMILPTIIGVSASALLTVMTLLFLLAYILIKGIPYLTPSLFAWEYNSENVSLMPALVNTVIMTGLSLLIAVPLGIFAAIYLVEYAKRGNRLVSIVRITAETLTGIPSIVYGLFGFLLFAVALGWSYTILGGAMTLAIMILPTIMRTTEEALKAVPDSYREGSFGLGAGRLRTVFQVVLPSAVPGILAGIILAVGRIVGETAALMYTAGTVAGIPSNLFGSGRTLAVHMYVLTNEGLYTNQSYATAVVLLVIVVCINAVSGFIAKKVSGKTA